MVLRAIKVEGLRELQKDLARAERKEVVKEIRTANKDAADIVKDEAKVIVPVVSGKLKKSIGSLAQRDKAQVKAGTAKGVQYAGVVHFGWPKRGRPPQTFIYDAMDKRSDEVRAAYEKNVDKALKRMNKY